MSESFTRPFTKAEIAAMRRLGAAEAERETGRGGDGLQRKFWAKVKRVAQRIPFAEDLLAAYFCTLDPATPNRVRLVLLGAIAAMSSAASSAKPTRGRRSGTMSSGMTK